MRTIRQVRYSYLALIGAFVLAQGCTSSGMIQEDSARQLSSSEPIPPVSPLVDSDYEIQPGDEIEILVWEQSNFNTESTVSSNGIITMPLIGEIEAGGLTHDQLEREVINRLSEYISGEINLTISIHNTENMLVSVFGMVQQPDNYPLISQTSLFKVLSTAGGLSEEANLRSVKIYRKNGNPDQDIIDLTQYLDNGQMDSSAIMVQPGDIIYVPRRQNAVREMSDFLRDAVMLFGIFRVFN
ncbi:MAG: polysaccharide biosynthesis/export family protein [Balneolaceae bacterium]